MSRKSTSGWRQHDPASARVGRSAGGATPLCPSRDHLADVDAGSAQMWTQVPLSPARVERL